MPASPQSLTIFHFTDLHARLGAEPGPAPGIPGLAAPHRGRAEILAGLAGLGALLADELGRTEGPSLLVCCGDVFGAEVAHDRESRGSLTMEALGLLSAQDGIDAALWLTGNHDVDYGLDHFLTMSPAAGMRILGDNVTVDGRALSEPLRIDVGGVRLALVAVTTPQTASEAPVGDRPRLDVTLPVPSATAHLADAVRLRTSGDVDAVVAIAHCFDGEDDAIARRGPDVLLGGHTHVFLSGRVTGGSRREKAGCHGKALGRVVLRPFGARWRVDPTRTALLLPDLQPDPDSPLLALARRAEHAALAHRVGPTIARCPEPIRGLDTLRSWLPSPIGSAVAAGLLDGARAVAGPVHCALINAGNVRADLAPSDGRITRADLADVLAFENELVLVEGPPALLRAALCNAVAALKLDRAGWLRTAGLQALIEADGTISSVRVEHDGALVPLHSLSTVRFATFDFLADGGHHYGMGAGDVTNLGLAADRWADALSPESALRVPPMGLVVDARFRQTDTQVVLNTLHHTIPGCVDWARDRQAT